MPTKTPKINGSTKPKAAGKPKTNGKADATDATISVILDRSGSMSAMRDATIEGFNGYLAEQAKLAGARFSLTQFDTEGIDHLYVDVPVAKVKPLTEQTYVPRGGTPLYDAVGRGIRALEATQPKGKVIVVIITDGYNNASHEFTREDVFELINQKQVKAGWEFVFMGAGVDAYVAGAAMGIPASSTHQYAADPLSQRQAFASVSHATTSYRSGLSSGMLMPDQPERDEAAKKH
jgi:Mg-chelatase subunit ChlD